MYSDNYKVITWHEDLWDINQEESIDYISAKTCLEIASQNGFKPLGQPTCGFVTTEQGMRVYFTQAFFKEYVKPKAAKAKSNIYKITPDNKKGISKKVKKK